jgi:hypothetical protein
MSGPVIHVANGRQTPMHRLQDAVPELLKCHDLNGWPWLPYPTTAHSVLSRSLTGPPLALPPLRDSWTPVCRCSLGAARPLVLLVPKTRGWDGQQ